MEKSSLKTTLSIETCAFGRCSSVQLLATACEDPRARGILQLHVYNLAGRNRAQQTSRLHGICTSSEVKIYHLTFVSIDFHWIQLIKSRIPTSFNVFGHRNIAAEVEGRLYS